MTTRRGRFVVVSVLNDHGAMTVVDLSRANTCQLAGCDRAAPKAVLETVEVGDVVRLTLRRIRYLGDAWWVEQATRVDEREAASAGERDTVGRTHDG